MQFKVPQNIDMADRIVGPLTLMQFLYVLGGGLLIYTLFMTIGSTNTTLFTLLAFAIGIFSFALAFLRIQDQPFPRFVGAFIVFLLRPKARVWSKDEDSPNFIITPDVKQQSTTISRKTIKKSQLDQLIQVLDAGTRPADDPKHLFPPDNRIRSHRPVLDTVRGKDSKQ